MRDPGAPRPPGWCLWILRRTLPEREVRLIRSEMEELHARWTERLGRIEADRRVLRQWRGYPFRLLASRMAGRGRRGPGSARPLGGGVPWLTARSLAQSARALARAPTLTGAILVTVGLGIGGCTVVFSLVDAYYLRPLPYPEAERLLWIHTDAPPNRFPFSVADFQALQEQQTSFTAVGAYGGNRRTLRTADGVELVTTLEATPGLLDVWGVSLLQGRTPAPEEGAPGAPPTALVTLGFARRHLDAGPRGEGAVGRSVDLDGVPHEVLGVLPASLGPLVRTAEVVPTLRLEPPTRKGPFFLQVFGCLRPGVTAEAAHSELRSINARLFPVWADTYQDRNASWGFQGVRERVRGDVGPLLAILMAAVAMVLLIAVANAVNLLVARVNARGRELAVRAALGASRGRIWGHLLTESLLLAAGGVAVGLAAARLGVAALPAVASAYMPRSGEAEMSTNVVIFALALALASALLFATVPGLHHLRSGNLAHTLRTGGRGATAGRERQRSQRIMVAGQVALVAPLLTGAFLLLGSFLRLEGLDPGFDAPRVLSMRVSLSPAAHPDRVARLRFWETALERIEAVPGVEAAALASERPPEDLNNLNNFDLEDRPSQPGEALRLAAWVLAHPAWFDAMGIPVLEGRGLEAADAEEGAPPVAVVDQAWARANYPGESPVGRRLYSGGQTTGPRTTVVGVVGTVPYEGVGAGERGAVYEAWVDFESPFLAVRSAGDPRDLAAAVQEELRRLDPTAPLTELAAGEALMADGLARPRHLGLLATLFSAVALGLSLVGLYGVTAYAVQQRRGDIAVRLALGSDAGRVLRSTLAEGMSLVAAGLLAGSAGAWLVGRALASLLYGAAPGDPRAFLAAAGLLLGTAVLATLAPALRAVRVDPASALREE